MTLRKRRRTAMMILLAGVILALLGTDTGGVWLTIPGMALLLSLIHI